MSFKPELWNGKDPLYAPCLSWSGKHPTLRYPQWKCPKKYIDAGYSTKAEKIVPAGIVNDEHQAARALRCRHLTQELMRWWDGQDEVRVDPNTWQYLIARYLTDEFSPIQEVKANTKAGYQEQLAKLELAIGHMQIDHLTYEEIKRTQKAMQNKGRSTSYIHRFFNTLRRVAGYGKALKIQSAAEVASVLAEMRFQTGASRHVLPTREQVYRIVAEADAKGLPYFAVGVLLQYEFSLRAVDVRGQWLKAGENEGGIIRNGARWQDGLTWDMFDADLTRMEKVISKTAKSLPEPYVFDLTLVPKIRDRLLSLKPENAVGPVIRSSNGMPYTKSGWSQAWARLRKAAKVPENIWIMDLRAGGVTEAKNLGADPYSLRDAAQHADISTTSGYSRDRSEGANRIVQLRQNK